MLLSHHHTSVNFMFSLLLGDCHPEDISVLAADFRFVFTASGNKVFAVSRNKKASAIFGSIYYMSMWFVILPWMDYVKKGSYQ